MDYRALPAINASLNALSAVLLVTGYILIRNRQREAHKYAMLAAFSVSVLFLISYLVYHYQVGSVRFPRTGTIRTVYLSILTLQRAFQRRFPAHRKIARYTFPIWLYVSCTGVVVYWMLYRM